MRHCIRMNEVLFSYLLVEEKFSDEAVEELESLKNAFGEEESQKNRDGEISVRKTQTSVFSNVNGQKFNHKEITHEVDRNGKLIGKVSEKIDVAENKYGKPKLSKETEVQIPSEGINRVIVMKDPEEQERSSESRGSENGIEKINTVSSTKYDPLDMAEYIFWTGDEKTVALAVEEFLKEGLMSRQEAINFLQSLKTNLDFMQIHYQNLKDKGIENSSERKTKPKRGIFNGGVFGEKSEVTDELSEKAKLSDNNFSNLRLDSFEGEDKTRGNQIKKRIFNVKEIYEPKESKSTNKSVEVAVGLDDYKKTVNEETLSDSLDEEHSLEELVSQLVKMMFSQSLTKGNVKVQKALQSFSAFLQEKIQHRQISQDLEKKIFEVFVRALVETLTKHPEILNVAKEDLKNVTNERTSVPEVFKRLIISRSENENPTLS